MSSDWSVSDEQCEAVLDGVLGDHPPAIDKADAVHVGPVYAAAQVVTSAAEVGPRAWSAQLPAAGAAPTAFASPAAVRLLEDAVGVPPRPPLGVVKFKRKQRPPTPVAFLHHSDGLCSRLVGVATAIHGGSRARARLTGYRRERDVGDDRLQRSRHN